jgi:hypothetical protein
MAYGAAVLGFALNLGCLAAKTRLIPLRGEFPENRETNREILKISTDFGLWGWLLEPVARRIQQLAANSLFLRKQRIFLPEQGMIHQNRELHRAAVTLTRHSVSFRQNDGGRSAQASPGILSRGAAASATSNGGYSVACGGSFVTAWLFVS